MLYMDNTLDEEDDLMIFDELETISSQNFFADDRPTTRFPPAFHVQLFHPPGSTHAVTENNACGHDQTDKLILVFVLRSKAL